MRVFLWSHKGRIEQRCCRFLIYIHSTPLRRSHNFFFFFLSGVCGEHTRAKLLDVLCSVPCVSMRSSCKEMTGWGGQQLVLKPSHASHVFGNGPGTRLHPGQESGLSEDSHWLFQWE